MIYTLWAEALPVSVQSLVQPDLGVVNPGNYCSVNVTLIEYELKVLLLSSWYLICVFLKRIAQWKTSLLTAY